MSTDENFQKLTELIHDDNAIVTSTYFSSISKLNINLAQDLLDKYAETQEENDVACTYIITGTDADNGICVLLSKQNELEHRKALLKNIITQHVYSLQKNKNIDIVALINVDPFSSNVNSEPLKGSVVCSNAIKRKLKKKPNPDNVKKEVHTSEPKQNNKVETKIIKTKKNSIESFCSTSANISTGNSFKPKIEPKAKQKNIMANFFAKTSETNQTNRIKNEGNTDKPNDDKNNVEDDSVEEDLKNCEPMEIDKDESIKENITEVNGIKPLSKDDTNTPKQKKSKKRQTGSKSGQPSKKRKRIVETQDSDSDIFASSESEVEVVPDIHLEDFEEEKPMETLPSKPRQMKQITEEFMDEDGYMNTVKKYVMLSDEEDKEQKPINIIEKDVVEKPVAKIKDTPPVASAKDVSSPPKKSNKNGKGKNAKLLQNQPSIMSFFKKN